MSKKPTRTEWRRAMAKMTLETIKTLPADTAISTNRLTADGIYQGGAIIFQGPDSEEIFNAFAAVLAGKKKGK